MLELQGKSVRQVQVNNFAVGEAARRGRKANKLLLKDVAAHMGFTAAYLSDLEAGRRAWREDLVEKFNAAITAVAPREKGKRAKK